VISVNSRNVGIKSTTNDPKSVSTIATSCNFDTVREEAENIKIFINVNLRHNIITINIIMIVYTPLNLPKLEPDNWDTFWNIWNSHSDFAVKTAINGTHSRTSLGSNSIWRGLDIFKKLTGLTSWECPYFDISVDLPLMYASIGQLNIKTLYRVRLLQSLINISSHADDNSNQWKIRGFLHYTDIKSQWYFTRPGGSKKTYATLPSNIQWFAYNDGLSWHGTDFNPDHKKILIQLYFHGSIDETILQSNIKTYKDYIIEYI